MDSTVTARRVLARAAVMAGGADVLAARLSLTQRQLADYLTGAVPIPDPLFLSAIDVVLEDLPDPRAPARADAAPRRTAPGS